MAGFCYPLFSTFNELLWPYRSMLTCKATVILKPQLHSLDMEPW